MRLSFLYGVLVRLFLGHSCFFFIFWEEKNLVLALLSFIVSYHHPRACHWNFLLFLFFGSQNGFLKENWIHIWNGGSYFAGQPKRQI